MRQLIRRNGKFDGLRAALLALVLLGVIGTAGELALERHWHDWIQVLPWVAVGGICVGLTALSIRTTPATIWLARALAALAVAFALVGIWQHLAANYDTAPLDYRYTDIWETMTRLERWWAVLSGAVGPAPLLASGILLQVGVAFAALTGGLDRTSR